MRPIVCNTELAFIIPINEEKKVSMSITINGYLERKMKTSDE